MSAHEAFRSRTFARDRRTWLATLALAAIAWLGTDAWLNRHVRLAGRRPAAGAMDSRFVVLAYDRIVFRADGRSLDGARLREELRALAAAGWQAVTLAEVQDAFRGLATLPAKPLLLTFDEGYLGTYEFADPVLRELHWPAVMFLRTDRQESRDVSFLFWDRLRRMRQSGLWELASGDPPQAPPAAVPTAFPSEPPGVALIAERVGAPGIAAWAPRGVDPLASLGHPEGGPACGGRDCAPWLGFADDGIGANDPGTSPFRIARLRVHPSWSTAELLSRLELAVDDPASARTQVIVDGRGAPEDASGELSLEGSPRAEAWFPAARWADDWALDLSLRVDRGEFWIVQPSGVPGHEWRFGGAGPEVYIQTRSPGRPPDVLATASTGVRGPEFHKVRVVKRGGGLVVLWDGHALFPGPVAIPNRWRGKLGLVAYQAGGAAGLTAREASLGPIPYRVLAAPTSPDAAEIAGWVRDAESIAALCPAWASVDGDAVREVPVDRDLFRILARRYAWDVIPAIDVRGATPPGDATARWLAGLPERVSQEGWAGVRLNLRGVSSAATPAWTDAASTLNVALRREGKRLVTSTP